MAVGSGFSRTMSTMISNYVKDFLLVQPSIYKFFQQNNLIRKIPGGQDRWRYFDDKNPGSSQMGSSIHDPTIVQSAIGETDIHLVTFAAKVIISKNDVDKFKTSMFVNGNLVQKTIQNAVRTQLNQIDQFLVWGDLLKDPVSAIDPVRGTGTYTGILNGGTNLAAGDGSDNNMTANGDFVSTLANYYDALQAAAHQSNEYILISDPATRKSAFQGNHYLSTTGSTEYARVLNDYPWIKQWIATPNCHAYGSATYRMALMQPKQRVSIAGKDKIVNCFEAIMGYEFEVTPVANGGLTSEGNYEAFLQTSIAFVEFYSTAIQRSGDLTLA